MTMKEYLQKCNEEYKALQAAGKKPEEAEYNRKVLLGLPQVQCTEIELRRCLAASLPKTFHSILPLDLLKQLIRLYYLLTIDYQEGKPIVKEDYTAWLNLDTMELAASLPYDAFSQADNCVFIADYRKAGQGIAWNNLVLPLEAASALRYII